jgi:hypothetical protein
MEGSLARKFPNELGFAIWLPELTKRPIDQNQAMIADSCTSRDRMTDARLCQMRVECRGDQTKIRAPMFGNRNSWPKSHEAFGDKRLQ